MNASEARSELADIMNEEIDGFFDSNDNAKKPWHTERWDEEREKHLGGRCEWCGESEETLNLHHTDSGHTVKKNWRRVWMRVEDELFQESDDFDGSMIETTDCCPRCQKQDFYHRKTMDPPFRCQACDYEFGEPGKKPAGEPKGEYFVEKLSWVRDNLDVVLGEFERRYKDHWDGYFDLSQDSVVTICRTCHFNWHENFMKPCRLCGDGYGKSRTDITVIRRFEERTGEDVTSEGVYLCWDHFADLKGLEECDCGNGWYDPMYSEKCKSCRQGRRPK